MRLNNDSNELSTGRLFIHGRLTDPMTGGPLYCRILSYRPTRALPRPAAQRAGPAETPQGTKRCG